jgi:hypothetical protein
VEHLALFLSVFQRFRCRRTIWTRLSRTGPEAACAPLLELPGAVIARHTAAIPFENLDIVLRRPVRLDNGAMQAKARSAPGATDTAS